MRFRLHFAPAPWRAFALALGLAALAPAALHAQSTPLPDTTGQVQVAPSMQTLPAVPTLQSQQQPQRQQQPGEPAPQQRRSAAGTDANRYPATAEEPRLPPETPSEFEVYVQRLANNPTIRRFGIDLVTPGAPGAPGSTAPDYSPLVPPDYLVQVGDEVAITIWGSVDADLRLVVDRSGRISLPRVGSIMLAGVRYADLPAVVGQRVGQVYKNFHVSVSLGQLRGLRVYVTGFVQRPGAVTVNALSTITAAVLRAGGPSAAGSLRNIELRRGGQVVARLDLYDLLLNGNEAADRLLQPGDVIRVGAIGPQVALIGSVNQPAIFELQPGETVADVLKMGGGFAAVADTHRLTLERLDDRASTRITELALPAAAGEALKNADVLRAFSAVDSALPIARQNKRVHVDGEVLRPGDYVLPPASTLGDALRAAGGLTANAYVYGTEFARESVRQQQQQNYDRALRDLEASLARANSTQRVSSTEDASVLAARSAAANQLISGLRTVKPTGRVVLQLNPDSRTLPDLALEDGDSLHIPARPLTVGVFGSVFNPGSYLYAPSRTLEDYLRLAGGPTRGADKGSVFVVRADGTVSSALQSSGWLGGVSDNFWQQTVQPGDTIFAPEELNKTTLVQGFKDWTQILYQFGLGVAGLKVVGF
ncbi:MAG: SLBB domain-containing protein [Burkholderiales bacterium]|nr:SLBB domain-containing protein [Burkholderiales bacterium]